MSDDVHLADEVIVEEETVDGLPVLAEASTAQNVDPNNRIRWRRTLSSTRWCISRDA